MLSFVLLMVYRCVSADAVPLLRDEMYFGVGNIDGFADSSVTIFEIPFDAFAFMGPSKNLFLSCVMCLHNCAMVSNM